MEILIQFQYDNSTKLSVWETDKSYLYIDIKSMSNYNSSSIDCFDVFALSCTFTWIRIHQELDNHVLLAMPFLSRQKSPSLKCSRFNLNFGQSTIGPTNPQADIKSSSNSAFVWSHPANSTGNAASISSQEHTVDVQFLDKSAHKFSVDKKWYGFDLLTKVFQHLDLKESKYFGLLYCENESFPGSARWLDPKKLLKKQLKDTSKLYFRVKFFAENPDKLIDEYTRYLYVMQLRREIRLGNIYVDRNEAVKLAGLLMQADYGNCDTSESSKTYSSSEKFVPLQGPEFLNDVQKEHILLEGISPSGADLKYLEIVKHLDMYGVEIHHAIVSVREAADLELKIGVCSKGIVIFQGFQKISQFAWNQIAKISFRRRHFLIFLLRGVSCDDYPSRLLLLSNKTDSIISLILSSYQASKSLWKSCVDHHAFFRIKEENASSMLHGIFPRITFDLKHRDLSLNERHSRPHFTTRMAFQLCDPARSHKRNELQSRKDDEDKIGLDSDQPSETQIVNIRQQYDKHDCKRSDSFSFCNCISESSRFPSPSPSHASVYSTLVPQLNNDVNDTLFLEPYRSLRPHTKSGKDYFDNNVHLMPRKQIIIQRKKSRHTSNSSSLDQYCSENEDSNHYLNESLTSVNESNLHVSMQTLKRDLQSSAILSAFEVVISILWNISISIL
ncbi:hypothetical protein GJ496_003246, partial [Pomphorhynchus laevis]